MIIKIQDEKLNDRVVLHCVMIGYVEVDGNTLMEIFSSFDNSSPDTRLTLAEGDHVYILGSEGQTIDCSVIRNK